jgi:RNA polymerase sigma factor (sigma-70 family)
MNNSDLINRIKSGDEKILILLYENYRDEFINWSNKNFGAQKEQAKDAFQEAILDFNDNIVSGKLLDLTCSFKTYLFQIGRNKVINILRKEQRLTYHDNLHLIKVNEYLDFMDEENKSFTQEQISQAMEKLPDDCKEVLKLHYFKEYDMESIAREMSYKNADTAKSKKAVCMKRLIVELNKLKMILIL